MPVLRVSDADLEATVAAIEAGPDELVEAHPRGEGAWLIITRPRRGVSVKETRG